MHTFFTKPIKVNAVQWTGTIKSTRDVLLLAGQNVGDTTTVEREKFYDYGDIARRDGYVLLGGNLRVSLNDWVVKPECCKSISVHKDGDFQQCFSKE